MSNFRVFRGLHFATGTLKKRLRRCSIFLCRFSFFFFQINHHNFVGITTPIKSQLFVPVTSPRNNCGLYFDPSSFRISKVASGSDNIVVTRLVGKRTIIITL